MSEIIKVENLGKKYIIRHRQHERYTTLRDELTKGVRSALSGKKKSLPPKEDFWALKDVSFEVNSGEKLGIIGRNGAGKTTLLKVLSRITDPSSGKVGIKGRIASLLEVGTGFHPELTGRENIFLNGSILGMSRGEIKNKFDEIVDFAETERFLDTPVKRYSSGMYVRLAFAVAAHLEPEILMIDEVLAVGDVQFQKKCLGKMQDVAGEGRTVLFVSHQMEAISKLCDRCLLLQNGQISMTDSPSKVIDHYLSTANQVETTSLVDRTDRQGDGRIRFTDTWVEDESGNRVSNIKMGSSVKILASYEIKSNSNINSLTVAFAINSINNVAVTDLSNINSGNDFGNIPERGCVECIIPKLPLNVGRYSYNVIARSGMGIEDWILEAGYFDVEGGDFFNSGKIPDPSRLILIDHHWMIRG